MKPHQTEKKPKKYAWFLSISAVLAVLTFFVVYFWLTLEDSGRADLLLFFGRFHILLVHLPIALLLLAAIMELFSRFRPFEYLGRSVTFVLVLSATASIASVFAGLMLATGGGYNESLLNSHKWWGIGVTFFTIAALVFKILPISNPKISEIIYGLTLTVAVVSLFVASHLGGSLTHGQNYLIAYMPDQLKNLLRIDMDDNAVMFDNIDEAVIFSDLVFPVFNDRCVSCHNPDRTEGDLRLDSFDHLMRGGENGPAIISRSPDNSDLFLRIIAPRNDDNRMPPGNRRPLADHQIEIIKWWILEGANPELAVNEAKLTPEIETILAQLSGKSPESPVIYDVYVEPADARAVAQLTNAGIVVTPVSREHNYLRSSFVNVEHIDPELVRSLSQIASQLVWLDLSYTPVSDEHLTIISGLHALTRLNLNATQITDEGIKHLGLLENLEHLSLVGTSVSDASLETLSELPNLKNLYIWQTNISDAGYAWLADHNPEIEADRGHVLAKPDTIILPADDEYGY
ncbi:MAG: hypothetical protein EA359_08505 [Balneolaceae bacterium]|nr:MAG: hypothetical protein EA359_08505 [Balneolaceae bacterium]